MFSKNICAETLVRTARLHNMTKRFQIFMYIMEQSEIKPAVKEDIRKLRI